MKKFLLFAAAATMAATAMAEVFPQAAPMTGEDITPAGFKFSSYDKEFIGFTSANVLPWNMSTNWFRDNYVKEGKTVGDGLIVVSGGAFYNGNAANVAQLGAGAKIIDMGGTVGKVLCLNFNGSTFPAKYKELTGSDLEIGEAPLAYPLLFWHFDHTKYENYLGQAKDGEAYMPLRVRMEISIYANTQSSTGEYWKAYMNDDQNNVRPAGKGDDGAADILVNPAEFAYRWCEKSDDPQDANDDSVWDEEDEAGVWNPNRWLVYEWDVNVAAPETEGEAFQGAIRLKNEIPGGREGNFTVLVRSVNLFVPENENRDYIYAARPRTWNFYTVGTPASINDVVADAENAPAVYYNLQGVEVANPENGIYIVRRGSKVTKEFVK